MKYRLTLKDLPIDERPRERLCKYGSEVLSNAELLAIIIGTGSRDDNAVVLAQKLLTMSGEAGLDFLVDISVEELTKLNGISMAKACKIKAAVELGRRIGSRKDYSPISIRYPADVANMMMEEMRYLKKEYFKIVLLNIKNQVITVDDVSIGSLNASIVHPREVFQGPIRRGSASIVLVHNHPSGDPEPSQEDIQVTRRLYEAGKLLGVDVLDHIIIGNGVFVSLRDKGIL